MKSKGGKVTHPGVRYSSSFGFAIRSWEHPYVWHMNS